LRNYAKLRQGAIGALLSSALTFLAACSVSPVRLLRSTEPTDAPPILLARCDADLAVLCLVTFGIEPPDQMLIVLQGSLGLPEELELRVKDGQRELSFSCQPAELSPTTFYCTGPQVSLGSSIGIEVLAVQASTLLARGEFALTGLALPTISVGGVPSPTPLPTSTPRPTRTPMPATAYPNPGR
jgi:hypothetical protein